MENKINAQSVYLPSEDVVSRQIEDEFLLVPIASGIGSMEDELYTLNETGRIIWERMRPGLSVENLADELSREYDASREVIFEDICGILNELLKLKMVEKVE
ncbi:MAG: PqqD family protein [Desulforegulaceae bacterium]|nr:PqqD family protein [Desulforegulaceae bacterium]